MIYIFNLPAIFLRVSTSSSAEILKRALTEELPEYTLVTNILGILSGQFANLHCPVVRTKVLDNWTISNRKNFKKLAILKLILFYI